MKQLITVLFMAATLFIQAQTVIKDGKTYTIKKEKIFLDGNEVTSTLSEALKTEIIGKAATISEQLKADTKAKKEADQLDKANKKAEKALKKAEKARKKAEKALEQNQNAQDKLNRTSAKLQDAKAKYQKKKKKGKLSPNDDSKWLKKIKDLEDDMAKAKKKLERS